MGEVSYRIQCELQSLIVSCAQFVGRLSEQIHIVGCLQIVLSSKEHLRVVYFHNVQQLGVVVDDFIYLEDRPFISRVDQLHNNVVVGDGEGDWDHVGLSNVYCLHVGEFWVLDVQILPRKDVDVLVLDDASDPQGDEVLVIHDRNADV